MAVGTTVAPDLTAPAGAGDPAGSTAPPLPVADLRVTVADDVPVPIAELIVRGRASGSVTNEEVADALLDAELLPDAMDDVLRALAVAGVTVVEDADEDEAPAPAAARETRD